MVGATIALSMALAERSILAMEREDWTEADSQAARARSVVRDAHLDDYVTSLLVYAAAARVAIHQGDARRAHEDLARAQRLRPQLTDALPAFCGPGPVGARPRLSGAHRRGRGPDGVAGGRRRAAAAPRPRTLPRQADELRSRLGKIWADAIGASSLTAAELRLLPLLSTHYSFREIGERLHVSPNTVKSQAMSVYRKFASPPAARRSSAPVRSACSRPDLGRRPSLSSRTDDALLSFVMFHEMTGDLEAGDGMADHEERLRRLALHDQSFVESVLAMDRDDVEASGLDARRTRWSGWPRSLRPTRRRPPVTAPSRWP